MLRLLLSPLRTVLAITVAFLATWIAAWSVTFLAWRDPASPRIEGAISWWSKSILAGAGVKLTVRGLEHIEPGRSYVVVANHQGALDIPAHFRALPIPIRFLAKKNSSAFPSWALRSGQLASWKSTGRQEQPGTLRSTPNQRK